MSASSILVRLRGPSYPTVERPRPIASGGDLKTCPYCGSQIPAESKTCPICGLELPYTQKL